ncbi:MAG: phosphoadenylyl-sulfate reductase [Deltaproteobacteria bacterium]
MPQTAFPKTELEQLSQKLAKASAEEILRFADERFGDRATIASSFGVEDVVLIDLARKHAPHLTFFTLDTGRLHPETYEVMEAIRARYGVRIEAYFPERAKVEELERAHGYFSFRESLQARKDCCGLRKLEPLGRALEGKEAWVTGLRREQSPTRTGVDAIELDPAHGGIAKLNPLSAWTERQVWDYVKANDIPYNALHDQGFPSIGCAPCTRAIKPYEDIRAGRWWWENPEQKECGLHSHR